MKKLKIPHTYTITSIIILICAMLTWIVPAGEYERQTVIVNGTERTIIVDGSFHAVDASPQSYQVFEVLLEGFQKQAGIIAFLLIIGGAFQILSSTRAVDAGIFSFLQFTRRAERHRWVQRIGVNNLVMTLIIFLFSTFGAVFGMSEETLPFVLILVPLAISMGYDSITGLCLVYVAAHVGFSGAVLNPFTVGLAQGLSELPLFSGSGYRLLCWLLLTSILVIVVLSYAARVKRNPLSSPMYEADAYWRQLHQQPAAADSTSDSNLSHTSGRPTWIVFLLLFASLLLFAWFHPSTEFAVGESSTTLYALPCSLLLFALLGVLGLRRSREFFILTILLFTIIFLIIGVMGYGWYVTEISAIFLAMGIFSGYAFGLSTDQIISQFLTGAKDILSAAIVVGLASGIILILQEGHIIDTILYNLAQLMSQTGKAVTLGIMYLIQTLINIVIPSGSAKAALTMPIMAPFSDVVGLSRQATVMAFQFGDGFTNMITPTSGVLMGALQMARIPYAVWARWFFKILLFFIFIGFILLLPTVFFQLEGF